MNFNNSKTKENLMKAFAGESQAKNRYAFAKKCAESKNYHVLAEVFAFTLSQEEAHAKVFYDFLSEFGGSEIEICGSYPIDSADSIVKILRYSENNENNEAETIYPEFARIAKEEGFSEIAQAFSNIAKIEAEHKKRFDKFATLMEKGELFSSSNSEKWFCLNCGNLIESKDAPEVCPVCKHNQGFFVREGLAPYTE